MPNQEELVSSASDVVGARVRQLRLERGWKTPQQLAERCAEIGAEDLTTNAIYALESGRRDAEGRRRRRVTVDEMIALAYALEVSPLALLLPKENEEYPLPEGISADARTVFEWFVGRLLPPFTEEPVSDEDRLRARVLLAESMRYVADSATDWLVASKPEDLRKLDEFEEQVRNFTRQVEARVFKEWQERFRIDRGDPPPGNPSPTEEEG